MEEGGAETGLLPIATGISSKASDFERIKNIKIKCTHQFTGA